MNETEARAKLFALKEATKKPPNTCWGKLIEEHLAEQGETWDDVVAYALGDGGTSAIALPALHADTWLTRKFNDGFGGAEGGYWTLWTKKRVYFPTEYDGSEDIASVPREPTAQAGSTCHCENPFGVHQGTPATLYEGKPTTSGGDQ